MTFVLHALQSKETARVEMDVSPMNDKKWTHERKKLLMSIRLRHESDFTAKIKKKRSTIWQTIRREIQEADNTFAPSVNEITRCFTNMLGTYRRIKRRNGTSGESATNWDFFDGMDDVYGTRSSISVPDNMLDYSLNQLTYDLSSNDTPSPSPSAPSSEHYLGEVGTAQKRKRNEVIEFLASESGKTSNIVRGTGGE
ncbi:uncharacterized protein LOC120781393 [Bactrocera tryoni]|uniref:uncharacterized protein LOC120781393 n=1 Tax=Bactrocera tryoni TaxID=59916 RepID=UPI001A975694|nr:uncharacterized protein LOC120781393 [Bactrocera tryoni]